MSRAAGYILRLTSSRVEVFDHAINIYGHFAEAVPEFAHSRSLPLVCFVSTDGTTISHIAHAKRGVRAGTDQRRLNLTNVQKLHRPVRFRDLIQRMPAWARHHMTGRSRDGGLVPPKTFSSMVGVLRELSDEMADLLKRYSASRERAIRQLSQEAKTALWAQKTAVVGALHLAGIERTSLHDWSPGTGAAPVSFVEGLAEARVPEDMMIFHDHGLGIPGLAKTKSVVTGAARFEDASTILEVIVANRTALEQQTGADLIYFNSTYPSFVLVQYKAMEPKAPGETSHVFRFPNAQLTKELAQMETLRTTVLGPPSSAHRHDYRLNDNPFFLKLCARTVFNPDDVGLVPGMYLPLDYWRHIERDSDLVGPKGGRRVSYENVGRYLDNTAFCQLVKNAWVGTTPKQTQMLVPLIEQLLRFGRAAVIAVKLDKDARPTD